MLGRMAGRARPTSKGRSYKKTREEEAFVVPPVVPDPPQDAKPVQGTLLFKKLRPAALVQVRGSIKMQDDLLSKSPLSPISPITPTSPTSLASTSTGAKGRRSAWEIWEASSSSPRSPCSSCDPGSWSPSSFATPSPVTSPRARPQSVGPVRARPSTLKELPGIKEMKFSSEGATEGRRLSFTADSWEDVVAAIREEDPQLNWWQGPWNHALVSTPAAVFKSLATRSLNHWLDVYNRWQALGNWTPGQAPACVDAYQLQDLTKMPMPKVLELVQIFDPAAHAKIQHTRTVADFRKVKIPMPTFLSSAVFLSTAITKRQKIRFLLGVFDEDDSRSFDMVEFTSMLSSFLRGVACVFRLPRDCKPTITQHLGNQLFLRIVQSTKKPGAARADGSVPNALIEDWLQGATGDALAAPFALFLERYSAGIEEVPESCEDDGQRFYLSHTGPVDAPMETAAMLDSSFLRRSQIKVVHALYQHCAATRDFGLSHDEAERALGTDIDPEFWFGKLRRALQDLEGLRQDRAKFSFGHFLKRLCPRASACHVRMFQSWLVELEQMEELRAQAERSRQLLDACRRFFSCPILSATVRHEILSADGLRSTHRHDAASREELVAAFCPTGYRPKPGNSLVDKVVLEFLILQLAREEETLAQKEMLFAVQKPSKRKAPRSFLKADVPEATWRSWNQAFDILDAEGTGQLTATHLVIASLPLDVCAALCRTLGGRAGDVGEGSLAGLPGFCREAFLTKMADLSNLRSREEPSLGQQAPELA